jgi:AbrB family looped-hinge helix DNA binding protein
MSRTTSGSSGKRYLVHVGERGRMVLPADLRRDLNVRRGDVVILEELRGGTVSLRSARDVAASARGLFASAGDDRSLVDELLEERRAEARREAEESQSVR